MSITVATRSDRFVYGVRLLCGLQGKPYTASVSSAFSAS
jgi:hypothetical protein